MAIARILTAATLALVVACGDGQAGPDAGPIIDGSSDPLFPSAMGTVEVVEAVATDGSETGEATASFGGLDTTAIFYVEELRQGGCRLLAHEVGFCDPYCDMDELCTHEDVCQPLWAPGRSAGVITIEGASTTVTLTPSNGWYAAAPTPLPADLFGPGDVLTASAAGDEIEGFELETTGVAAFDLQLAGDGADELRLVDGADFTLSWTPAEQEARVRLRLFSPASWHGLPPGRILECDAPDTGSLTIPRELVEAFPEQAREESCNGYPCDESMFPRSTLLRYRKAAASTTAGEVELVAGGLRRFYLLHSVD